MNPRRSLSKVFLSVAAVFAIGSTAPIWMDNNVNKPSSGLVADVAEIKNSQITNITMKTDTVSDRLWKNEQGQFHRLEGPAVEGANGSKEWWVNGQRHRLDGPAFISQNGVKEWWLNGQQLAEAQFIAQQTEAPKTHWKNDQGQLHRLDGPAINGMDGSREWWVNGQRHRIDGPAIELTDGQKEWWLNGKRHRTDGPAVELADGSKEWWVNGQRHRTDGPAVEDADGYKRWYKEGQLHRTDGPAIEGANGSKQWWVNGQRHRIDGPALIPSVTSGQHLVKEWYLYGTQLSEEDFNALKTQSDTIENFTLKFKKGGPS